jgi:hypothetical protein
VLRDDGGGEMLMSVCVGDLSVLGFRIRGRRIGIRVLSVGLIESVRGWCWLCRMVVMDVRMEWLWWK